MQNFPQGSPQCVAAPAGFSLPRCFGNGNELDWQRTVPLLIRYCSGSAAKQFRRGFQRHAPGLMFFRFCGGAEQLLEREPHQVKASPKVAKHLARAHRAERTSSEQCPARAQARQAAQTARDKGRACRWITAARLSARTLIPDGFLFQHSEALGNGGFLSRTESLFHQHFLPNCSTRTLNLASVSSASSLANFQLRREKNAYESQPSGGNNYRLPPKPAQITTIPARMSTTAMPSARLISLGLLQALSVERLSSPWCGRSVPTRSTCRRLAPARLCCG